MIFPSDPFKYFKEKINSSFLIHIMLIDDNILKKNKFNF